MLAETKNSKAPMKFIVAFRIDDETTKKLMERCMDLGYSPEQIARYSLKKYLNELNKVD
jgi:hypothetical protein